RGRCRLCGSRIRHAAARGRGRLLREVQPMKCSQNAGFLIPRPCRTEATLVCSACHRWMCERHSAQGPTGVLCSACAAAQNQVTFAQQVQYRSYYGYDEVYWGPGYYYGGGLGYTSADYGAFEQRPEGQEPQTLSESVDGS